MHTGSHYGFSTYPIVNKSIQYIGNFHCQYYIWNTFHIIGHHQHTNIPDKDPDLYHFLHKEILLPGYKVHKKQILENNSGWKFIFHYIEPIATSCGISLLLIPEYLQHKKIHTVDINEEFIDVNFNHKVT